MLYGSAARGTHVPDRSDVNTLLICDAVDEDLFARLERPVRDWVKAGHPAPLILTEREWQTSADAFPIEYEDIREAHRLLLSIGIMGLIGVVQAIRNEAASRMVTRRDRTGVVIRGSSAIDRSS